MIKKLLTLGLIAGAFSSYAQSGANIYPSNLDANLYYDSYDDNTKTIKGVHFEVLTDGNNSNNSTPAFVVKIYLLVQGTQNPIFVKTIDFPNGQNELTATDWVTDVDLSQLTGISDGPYRVGVFVDANDDVNEPDENDNAILFQGSINYTSGGGGGNAVIQLDKGTSIALPNPISSAQISALPSQYGAIQTLKLFNDLGAEMKIDDVVTGVYFMQVSTSMGVATYKVVIQ
jgi:hypothetical protein